MSAVPEQFMRDLPKPREREEERDLQNFWHWFAVGVLVFCWVAEAMLCAQRGF